MRIPGFGKPKENAPAVAGDIACLGLSSWWTEQLSEAERATIRNAFKPMGAPEDYAIDRGNTTCEGSRDAKLLYTVAGWLKKDPALQLKILTESERRASYVLDRHFLYMFFGDYWYRLRNEQPGARDRAIAYYQQQIKTSKSAAAEWHKQNRDLRARLKQSGSRWDDIYEKYGLAGERPPERTDTLEFNDRLPEHTGFKQLAIIREKDGNFAEAIRLCQQAKKDGWNGDWDKRVARLEGKLAKS